MNSLINKEKRYIVKVTEICGRWSPKRPECPFWGHILLSNNSLEGYSCGVTFGNEKWFEKATPELIAEFYSGVTPLQAHLENITFFSATTPIFKGALSPLSSR